MIERHEVAALVPAFNEQESIGEVVSRLLAQVQTVLVVDDGSEDQTAKRARRAGAEVLAHTANRGKGAALKSGFTELFDRGFQYVIMLDGDGQHLPEELPRFIAEAERSGAQIVVGNRMSDLREMPLIRRWVNRGMSWMISRVCGQRIPDSQCGFRLVRRQIGLFCSGNAFDYESEMLIAAAKAGAHISSVPISTIYRNEVSKIRPFTDTIKFLALLARQWR